ncbi:MAG: (d)CMP kinase [Legionellaceae bacterium]|nr:(d)CMP kinase [Legionellaceae bacterium]
MIETQDVPVITLDGPSGTGKGTLCYRLAKHLGWHFLDSGAIYRVLAYAATKQALDYHEIAKLVTLAVSLRLRFDVDDDGHAIVFLDGEDVSQHIRSEQVGQDASKIAEIPDVREALLTRQRAFAELPGLVTDGRDMGTVVFPKAILKLYLYATAEERAMRRYLQLKSKGNDASLAQVIDELAKRDARDMARAHSPLTPASDAVQVDTTGLTIVQVLESILQLVRKVGL